MTSNDKTNSRDKKHSDPISIPMAARGRARSVSSASSGSASSSSDVPTPASGSVGRLSIPSPSPSTSPILSYFLAQSPSKTPVTATFPFKRKFGTTPVFEEEETEKEIPVAAHARRASVTVASRFTQNPQTFAPDAAHGDRGTNLLRRLSLSSAAFAKPQLDATSSATSPPSPPPNTAVSPTSRSAPFATKSRRSATISAEGGKPRRAPSPMGERILKGHFDGFN